MSAHEPEPMGDFVWTSVSTPRAAAAYPGRLTREEALDTARARALQAQDDAQLWLDELDSGEVRVSWVQARSS